MRELRLEHVERNRETPSWLTRLLERCVLPFERGKGPTERAPDIPLSSCYWEGASGKRGADGLALPASSVVVTFRWLRRELELANARRAHPDLSA